MSRGIDIEFNSMLCNESKEVAGFACIYARYSSSSQNPQSIEEQEAACFAYAVEHNYAVVRHYEDKAKSGRSVSGREGFLQLIHDAQQENCPFDTILIYKIDRWARSTLESEKYYKVIDDAGIRLVSVTEKIDNSPQGTLMRQILQAFAEFYSNNMAVNIRLGMHTNATKGKLNGKAPYGYIRNTEGYAEIDEDRAIVVREIFQRYAHGEQVKDIIQSLNERGVKTGSGGKWKDTSLQSILTRECYATGTYEWGGIRTEDAIPRIIDEELFERVQEVRERHSRNRSHPKVDYILSDKLYCGECGKPMTGESAKGKGGTLYHYYNCKRGCGKSRIPKGYIEDLVVDCCRSVLESDTIDRLAKAIAQKSLENDEARNRALFLEREIGRKESQIENLIDAIANGLSKTRGIERVNVLQQEIRFLEKDLEIEKANMRVLSEDEIAFFLHSFRGSEADNAAYRKALINILVNRVTVYGDHRLRVFMNAGEKAQEIDFDLEQFVETESISGCSSDIQLAPPTLLRRSTERRFYV